MQAAVLLKYYPTLMELEQVHKALPEMFGPCPPFSRLRGSPQTDLVVAALSEVAQDDHTAIR